MGITDQQLNELVVRIQTTRNKKRRDDLYAQLWQYVEKPLRSSSDRMAARHRLDPDDAFSVGCEALLIAVDSYRQFNNEDKEQHFMAFLLSTVAKRRILTLSKKLHGVTREPASGRPTSLDAPRTQSNIGDELGLGAILPDESHADPLVVLAHRSDLSQLWRTLKAQLSDYELEVVRLYAGGASYVESADRLDRSDTKSIDNALVRIKRKAVHIYERHLKRTAEDQKHCR